MAVRGGKDRIFLCILGTEIFLSYSVVSVSIKSIYMTPCPTDTFQMEISHKQCSRIYKGSHKKNHWICDHDHTKGGLSTVMIAPPSVISSISQTYFLGARKALNKLCVYSKLHISYIFILIGPFRSKFSAICAVLHKISLQCFKIIFMVYLFRPLIKKTVSKKLPKAITVVQK